MKRTLTSVFVATIILASCNGTNTQKNVDTTQGIVSDSMPVVKPGITDTEGVIKTPPVHDNNVIVPDSSHLKN